MTDKELKKMSRKDLLELLVSVSRERDCLRAELKKTKAELDDKKILIGNAGSIAEAALRLNGVFEAAEAAARQYLDNVKRYDAESGEVRETSEKTLDGE